MVANYKARKRPQSVDEAEWWEEAKGKSPDELNRLYPPLQPKEWYRAELFKGGIFERSRKLNFDFASRKHTLEVSLKIHTESGVPIKEVHGHLAILKENEVVYEVPVEERKDVSFDDGYTFCILFIDYDDANPKHRTLRFAKDSELTPVFTVRKVVFADGKENIFD